MSPYQHGPETDEYMRHRAKARRRPAWLLRRRERQIVAKRYPDATELAELAAIRKELSARGRRPAPMSAPA